MMNVETLLAEARDTMTVEKVFGRPHEVGGITFVPAAAVRGGAGGGEGEGESNGEGQQTGSGGGFGVSARPVGAYQIKNDEVTWVPAADTTRVIIMSQIATIVALLVFRSIVRIRRRSKKA